MLTPPLLMCAVVLIAVGAFLRHEMGRKRPQEDEDADAGRPAPTASERQSDTNVAGAGSSADSIRER